MKNAHYYLAVTLAIALNTSCTKDDEDPPFVPAQSTITGEWFVVEFQGPGAYDYNEELAEGLYIRFAFDEDGTGSWTYGYDYDFYWYEEGYYTTWSLEDNQLEIVFGEDGEDGFNFEIQSLSDQELTLLSIDDTLNILDAGLILKLERE